MSDIIKEALNSSLKLISWVEKTTTVYKTEDWQEDYGNCLFFHFDNFKEPPEVYVGCPLDGNLCGDGRFKNGYWTHFVRMDFNVLFKQAEKAGVKKWI